MPIVFGIKSKNILLSEDGYIKFIFGDDLLTVRTYYEYKGYIDEDDKELGFEDKIINEKAIIKRGSIDGIGCAYDNKNGCFYVTMQGHICDNFTNVETADGANELLNIIKE